ncbi:MAG: DUF2723 domain-containing protein [Chloroflexi bacterium]|nr:DUF2723 domain-containing protein [Chloroflexota bacterium]
MIQNSARSKFFSLWQDPWLAVSIFFAALLLYLRTLAPDVVDADGGEFQFAAWNFSFVHPTGYPLYLILGGIFQHLIPIGNPAFRLNLFTAITAALAVAAVYLAAQEIAHHRGAAIIATLAFAMTRMFWYDASAAETYDLNAFFVALLIYLALRWQPQPNAKTFAVFCFSCGLALTHHRSIILWLPVFGLFFAWVIWKSQACSVFRVPSSAIRTTYHAPRTTYHVSRLTHASRFLLFTFCFLLPLLLYLYIPLRAPVSPYATLSLSPGPELILYDNSLSGLVNYLLGRVFQFEIGWDAVSVARLAAFPQLLFDQFGVMGAILGVVGFIAVVGRREWARVTLLFGGFVVTLLFAAVYHIGDIYHYYIPAYLVWAIWIGTAIAWIFEGATNRVLRIACSLILTGMVVAQLVSNYPYGDRSGEIQPRDQWARLLSVPLPQNAILISNDRDEMMPMWYMQYVENVRRDVVGLFPLITPAPQHANVVRLTDSVLNSGRPIYFIKPMPGIEVKYRVAEADGLWRVLRQTSDAQAQFTSDALFADKVRITGYDVERNSEEMRIAIYWQPQSKLDANYATFVHLLDAKGNKVAQGNDHQVGGEFYPTSMWTIGETLRDEQTIPLPPDLSGSYRLLVGMYRQSDSEMLGEPVEIGSVKFP